jgi:streptogramin lyase
MTSERPRRSARVALATMAIGLTALSVGCGSTGRGTVPAAQSPGPVQLRHLASAPQYVRVERLGHRPCATLGAAGAVWVADISDAVVTRIDPRTGAVTARIRTAAGPCGMAFGAHSIWVEDYTADAITRIALPSMHTSKIDVGTSPYDVTFADGAAWVTDYADAAVTRVDAATGSARTVRVGGTPTGIASAAGAIWVAEGAGGKIARIDATTLHVTQVDIGGSPAWTASDGSDVWVGDQLHDTVVRIDGATAAVVARTAVGSSPQDGDVYDGAVWFPTTGGTLCRIDPATNRLVGTYPVPATDPFVAAGYAGQIWLADFGGTDTVAVAIAALPG